MCLCRYLCVVMWYVYRWPQQLEEGIESPGAGVTGGSELSNVGAGTKCGSSVKETRALNCLVIPPTSTERFSKENLMFTSLSHYCS